MTKKKLVSGCDYCHLKADEHNIDQSNDNMFDEDAEVYGDWIDDLSTEDDDILLASRHLNLICEYCVEEERHYVSNIDKFYPKTKDKVLSAHFKYKNKITKAIENGTWNYRSYEYEHKNKGGE
tara:strand:+ start:254 stop:622 length:369 start_codon:yes stop_codon:yes gene_type:complete